MSLLNMIVLVTLAVGQVAIAGTSDGNWSGFRGNQASGVAEGAPIPATWDLKAGSNVAWTADIPGLAHSSPVVWENRVFITTAVSAGADPELKVGLYGSGDSAEDMVEHEWRVICLDLKTGAKQWQVVSHKGIPKVKRHTKATHCNTTPVTDGKHVIAFFGSEGMYAYDLEGKLQWKVDLGVLNAGPYNAPDLQWGFASSPVIADGKVVVQCDVLDRGFLAAFDVGSGQELWRTKRKEVSTWSTPTVVTTGGDAQVVVNGWKHIGGYDLATGRERWKLMGGGDVPVPTPIMAGQLIYITNAHGALAPLYAIRPTARGNITLEEGTSNEHIAWSVPRNGAYMQTPIVYHDLLYSCSDRGILKCYDAATGKLKYRKRLGDGSSGFTASPVATDGKIYQVSEQGDVYVIKPGDAFEQIAHNTLGEITMASPAIASGHLLFRTRHRVVAIRHKP
jgi:outer membrane protein assembly factor BamB